MIQGDIKKKKYEKVIDPDLDYTKPNVHHISSWWGLFGLVMILGLGYVSQYCLLHLPQPIRTAETDQNPESFISERAWTNLKILNEFGPKPVGSYANEFLAVDFLKREINFIQKNAHRNQRIINDVRNVSGAYYINFKPHPMTNVYRHVQNVAVKLMGENERNNINNHSVMLNCHFDTVPESPGASDDGGNCCVMLEILRVLSRQSYVNKHSIIFLFNGAEETPLQASHGFITQHEWATNVKVFLNLESAGSGGKEILFQSGPNHPWLIELYAKAVKYPMGQAAGEEIFQSGLIPSDTDFRIFRDFGHIPGMDFAHMMNGYRYHTKYDSVRYISLDVLQRTGDNMLAITKEMANCEQLIDTEQHAKGTAIFFDFLGLFFISYSKEFGTILNVIVVVLATTVPFLSLSRSTRGIQSKHLKNETRIGSISTVLSIAASAGVCYFIAIVQGVLDKTMTWYANPIVAIGLYCIPALFTQCFIHILVNKILGNKSGPLSLALKIQVQQCGTNLFWGSLVMGLTFNGYRIGYSVTLLLIFVFLSNMTVGLLQIQNSVRKWLYVQLISQIFIILWGTYFYHVLTGLFIPITGRVGAMKNPDITIGLICAFMTFLVTSYMSQLVLLLKNKKEFFAMLTLIFIFVQFCIMSTSIGFPYRDDSETEPKPQRHYITHAKRTFFDINGNVRYTDSGFWFREMDYNSRKTIESLATPDVPIPQLENNMCAKEVFCGLPIYSCRQLHTGGYWLPGPAPTVETMAALRLNSKTQLSDDQIRLNFTLTGKVLVTFLIRPKPGVTLESWNILDEIPEPNEFNGMKGYLVAITHGIESTPIEIILDLKSSATKYDGNLVDITVVTTHWEYYALHTPTFAKLLVRVPKWAFAVPSVASLNAYTF